MLGAPEVSLVSLCRLLEDGQHTYCLHLDKTSLLVVKSNQSEKKEKNYVTTKTERRQRSTCSSFFVNSSSRVSLSQFT